MEHVIIRNIRYEDIEDVAQITIDGWQTAYKGIIDDEYLNKMNKQEIIEKRKQDYNEYGYIVATLNNKVVGFCSYINSNEYSRNIENSDCEIFALYITPKLKRHKIGTQLLKYVEQDMRKQNKKSLVLWCLEENYPSREFYTKMGGTIVAKDKIKKGDKEYQLVAFMFNL